MNIQNSVVWLFLLLVFLISRCDFGAKSQPVDYVDPFICSLGDHGHQHPGACVPWGMVILGPDTYPSSLTGNGNWAHSGYNYTDDYVRGFSHMRIVGSGGTRNSDREKYITLLPVVGQPEINPEKRFYHMDKKSEKAFPGFYGVNLDSLKIQVQLTATAHAGLHRYIFPKTDQGHIVIKLGRKGQKSGASINILNSNEIVGTNSKYMFFCFQFSKPFKTFSTWKDVAIHPDIKEMTGGHLGAILDFQTKEGDIIYVKAGFSTVNIEQARKNLQAEIPAWDFDQIVNKARHLWADRLDKIELDGDEESKEIFYTHLYHSFITPNNITDINGRYVGTDGNTHETDGYLYYDNYAFWDDYRTKYPLLTLTQPDIFNDIVRSLLDIYDQGLLCKPYLSCRYEHMITAITDASAKGLLKYNISNSYESILELLHLRGFRGNENIAQFAREIGSIGYIPERPDLTMEYAYDYWCAAQLAKIVEKNEDYDEFLRRADFYKNTWDKNAPFWRGEAENIFGFFRARARNGEWLEFPHDPRVIDEKYVYEGSMWHWRWFVPHDVAGLIDLVGGKEKFVQDLDYFFSYNVYQPGNQPDLHTPFLFNYAGAPWLTQKYVRQLLTEPRMNYFGTHEFFDKPIYDRVYKATPDGYLREMDDDYGCMAAWYVMSSMGLYQVCVGQPVYQLTAPVFKKVTINLDADYYPGSQFTIVARNLSQKNIYIQSAKLNGEPYNKSWITHQEIVNGGTLVFEMGSKPNKEWGRLVE